MPYIDMIYFNNTYQGVPVADTTLLERLILRASEDIDEFTGYKIQDLSTHPQFVQDQVKKATAAQVEHLYDKAITGGSGDLNIAVGTFKYVSTGSGTSATGDYSSKVYKYLAPTGLLYGGVTVL